MNKSRPIIGITMGDPAGGGPEITLKALSHPEIYDRCRPLVVGDSRVFHRMLDLLYEKGILEEDSLSIHEAHSIEDCVFEYGTIDILHMDLVDMDRFVFGKVQEMCGHAAFACVEKVISLAMAGDIDATVTNALNKEAMNLAGHHFSGHTEIYAHYTGTRNYAMMLVHEDLRVVHVSTHVSLREACDRAKKDRILSCICMADRECRKIGIANPRIGVAGLNPHSGENGLFGREEIEEIIPAIEEAAAQGIDVDGPVPPDTVFSKARGGWYDIVVAMYHDQGHIPLKLVGFVYDRNEKKWEAVKGVNVTLGLPIIRTSVDHGTAFDCAGQGVMNEISLLNAIDYAIISTRQ